MAVLRSFLLLTAILFAADFAYAKNKYHPTVTYFRRKLADGSDADAQVRVKFPDKVIKDFDERATLYVKPSYINNGEEVTVVWAGVVNATKDDIIGFYCPKTDPAKHYLDYIDVTACPTWAKGFGNYTVKLYNMRSVCEFRYYRKRSTWTAVSNEVVFKGGVDEPLMGHLSLTGDPTEMRVMWISGTAEKPLVLYGEGPSVPLEATGTTRTYNASNMCGPPASTDGYWDPGYIHDVLLTGLKPSTRYYYTYGSYKMLAEKHSFRTGPRIGPDASYKFNVFGDMGILPAATPIANEMVKEAKNGSSFLFHNGDLGYGLGYLHVWEQWQNLIEPFVTLMPHMVGVGNHEYDHAFGGKNDPSGAPGNGFHPWWAGPNEYGNDSYGECGVPTNMRFHMPDNGNSVFWYSFNYGSMHLIMMSTEHDFTKGSPQYQWLQKDLADIDRSVTPWVVIGGHRPMYTSQQIIGDYMISIGMRHYFEDLLLQYKVDMAFWAHYHSYERTCQVNNTICQKGAPVHIVVGTAGKELDTEPHWKFSWSEFYMNAYGYGRVTVHDRHSLLWEWIKVDEEGARLVDSVLLEK